MARLAVITDRGPDDPEWKGAFAWDIILSLAESQHEVLALTTVDVGSITFHHSRLTVAQPAPSFGLRHLPHWLQAVLRFKPDVIHTFSLRARSLPALTVWPMLESALKIFPRVRCFSTNLERTDHAPFKKVETPLEIGIRDSHPESGSEAGFPGRILVPAPVSEWKNPLASMLSLNEFLLANRDFHVVIVGGWGGLSLGLRREGWKILEHVSQQIHLTDSMSFEQFVDAARASRGMWLRSLEPSSWRAAVAAQVARGFGLPLWGDGPEWNTGSPANFLSRLYCGF